MDSAYETTYMQSTFEIKKMYKMKLFKEYVIVDNYETDMLCEVFMKC